MSLPCTAMSDVVGPSATTSNVADDEVLRRERLLQLIPSEKEYKKLEENKSLFPPDPKVYGHALKYTKSPAFPAIDDDDVRYNSTNFDTRNKNLLGPLSNG